MDRRMSSLGFRLMALMFKVRDFLRPRVKLLKEAGIQPGFCVLDYGCGPGSYIEPLAELVGPTGKIYALDLHPLAVKKVQKMATRKGIQNIETIESECSTGLSANQVDVVLLYDVFHELARPYDVLRELHRIMKPGGALSFSDHHMTEPDILARVTRTGLFELSEKGERTYRFSRVG